MPNGRMFPPGDGRHSSITVNGRNYSAAVGSFVDVPTFDAHPLQANGWTRPGDIAQVGPTSARPATPSNGLLYFDTTLTAPVFWDRLANVWRNVFTGASA